MSLRIQSWCLTFSVLGKGRYILHLQGHKSPCAGLNRTILRDWPVRISTDSTNRRWSRQDHCQDPSGTVLNGISEVSGCQRWVQLLFCSMGGQAEIAKGLCSIIKLRSRQWNGVRFPALNQRIAAPPHPLAWSPFYNLGDFEGTNLVKSLLCLKVFRICSCSSY